MMSYIVILMSFQTIYSINYGQNYEMFIAPPPPSVYRELSESPARAAFNARKYFGAPP
jgi:hypothetical protein